MIQLELFDNLYYPNTTQKEKNEKIDRVLWNVLANGTSDITDLENAVNKLFEEVLSKQGKEADDAWNKYLDDMYYERKDAYFFA